MRIGSVLLQSYCPEIRTSWCVSLSKIDTVYGLRDLTWCERHSANYLHTVYGDVLKSDVLGVFNALFTGCSLCCQ